MVSTATVSYIITLVALGLAVGTFAFLTLLLIPGTRQKMLAGSLYIIVIPLLIGFAVIAGLKVAEILLAGGVGTILPILILIGLLASQYLLEESPGSRRMMLAGSLNMVTIPLLIGFVIIVGLKVAEI